MPDQKERSPRGRSVFGCDRGRKLAAVRRGRLANRTHVFAQQHWLESTGLEPVRVKLSPEPQAMAKSLEAFEFCSYIVIKAGRRLPISSTLPKTQVDLRRPREPWFARRSWDRKEEISAGWRPYNPEVERAFAAR